MKNINEEIIRINQLFNYEVGIIINEQVSGETKEITSTKCPDPKNPDSYGGIREIKGLQGLLNSKVGSNLKIDGKHGPATDKALRTYMEKNGLEMVMCTTEWCGAGNEKNVDTSYAGDKTKSKIFEDLLIKDGIKNFMPVTPEGCKKYRFDK